MHRIVFVGIAVYFTALGSSSVNKSSNPVLVLKQYVVSIDGSDPFIKWQMEKGLDWTISSVAGESYRVDVSRTVCCLCCLCHLYVIQLHYWLKERCFQL